MGKTVSGFIAAIVLLAGVLITNVARSGGVDDAIALQQSHLSSAIAEPTQGIGEFEWKNSDGGATFFYEPANGFLWAIFPENHQRYNLKEAEELLKTITISGYKGWEIVTEEAFGSVPEIINENGTYRLLEYRLPMILDYSKGRTLLTKVPYSYFYYALSNGIFIDFNASSGELLASRPFSELDWLIFRNRQLTDFELLKKVTAFLLKERLSLTSKLPPALGEPVFPALPEISKGEFETSQRFTARKDSISLTVEKKKQAILEHYLEQQKARNLEVTRAEEEYLHALEGMNEKILSFRQDAVERAWQLLFGDPIVEKVVYNADEQVFSISLRSTRRVFRKDVVVKIPSPQAPRFKEQLLNKSLIPVMKLSFNNGELLFASMDIKTNEKLLSEEYNTALTKNTIEAYGAFMNKYPEAAQAADAKAQITALEQAAVELKAKKLEAERQNSLAQQKAEETDRQRRVAQQKAEHTKYYRKKEVGDKVCIIFTTWWFGTLETKVTGYVEQVSGQKIQIRIADTENQTRRYNGADLKPGTILWDAYNNWKHCE